MRWQCVSTILNHPPRSVSSAEETVLLTQRSVRWTFLRFPRPFRLARQLMDDLVGDTVMAPFRVLSGLLIVTFLSTTPALADQGRRQSEPDRRREQSSTQSDPARERAVPRDAVRIESEQRRDDVQR